VGVDWDAAQAFCRWAYPEGGRLPSEAEWELAARGPAGREFPWGDRWQPGAANAGTARLSPVGSFAAGKTPEGIHDLCGNAFEWTASPFERYDGQPLPSNLRNRRVLRGGSSSTKVGTDGALELHAWYRDWAIPATRSEVVGFRCAWSRP
jgi:formylglycine-generating enzyme required for sulfatase activity